MASSRPTVYDVAQRAGVSIATVSFAFRRPDKVREDTRRVVLEAAREIGYVPSGSARSLARGRTGVLGLHLFDMLLDEEPWSRLAPLFDFTVFVDVRRAELERRLMQRWRDQGRSDEDARAWISSNDMPNIERVLARRRTADMIVGDPG